jgi:adenylylsulfate kinase
MTGVTVWLTGLPGSGKTSIAREMAARLDTYSVRSEILDGDELRSHLCADLGFSRADRATNVRRIGYVAELLARNGVVVLVPVIAPYADIRAEVRAHHKSAGTPYVEAFVDTPLEVCVGRDVKGLYGRQRTGEIIGLTGIDDPYEVPVSPDIRVTTVGRLVSASTDGILHALIERRLLASCQVRCHQWSPQ